MKIRFNLFPIIGLVLAWYWFGWELAVVLFLMDFKIEF